MAPDVSRRRPSGDGGGGGAPPRGCPALVPGCPLLRPAQPWAGATAGVRFTYLKLHKPVDVVTTTSAAVPNNILACLAGAGHAGRDRVFPVGRLDEATSGVILLTSDGSLVNAALGAGSACEKVYLVRTDAPVTEEHVDALRRGVVIRTVAQYARGRTPLAAPTLPCLVERASPPPGPAGAGGRGGPAAACWLRVTLREGRNRQIRKMLAAVGGYTVRAIHRVGFMGIGLGGVPAPGDFAPLDDAEMATVRAVIHVLSPTLKDPSHAAFYAGFLKGMTCGVTGLTLLATSPTLRSHLWASHAPLLRKQAALYALAAVFIVFFLRDGHEHPLRTVLRWSRLLTTAIVYVADKRMKVDQSSFFAALRLRNPALATAVEASSDTAAADGESRVRRRRLIRMAALRVAGFVASKLLPGAVKPAASAAIHGVAGAGGW
ncbi:hypothetical protein I4F81_005613 [Pyropia yezoensis]|uniref:Uncharacterized protein n=1 Tax=Pyropia yezoensis TaxID=2788 RepID=A0ACC3BZA8_PYRYE|nr:hypothetical protein I4F81_005613 [Neopyropia yezoensis]